MINIAFALFGTICLFGIVAEASRNQNVSRVLYVLIACALILYCGLREIGDDQDSVAYSNYYNMDSYSISQVTEPTFLWIVNLTRYLSPQNGLFYLFMIYAILGVTLKFVAIRKLTDLYWLSVLTYFSTYFLLHEFTQIRASIASGLVLLSIKFIFERKLTPFLLAIGIASLFHYSALLAFPLYFLSNYELTKKSKFAIAMAVPAGIVLYIVKLDIIYIIPIDLVRSKIEIYMETESLREIKLNVFNAIYLVKYALLYIFLFFSDKISGKSKFFPVLLKIYAISLFSYLALSFNSTFAMRISELFGIVEIIMIPLLYYAIRPKGLAIAAIIILAGANLALGIYQSELIQLVG